MNAVPLFDLFAATFILFLGFGGFKRGFITEIGRLVSLIFTLWLGVTYYVDLANVLHHDSNLNPYIILFISFSLIFIVALIATRIIVELIDQFVGFKKIRRLNQLLGFVVGIMKGTIATAIILWTFEMLPVQHWSDNLYKESKVARIVKNIRDKNIEFFGWDDPVEAGRNYVSSKMVDEFQEDNK
jgi:uncharacterized membrane protein required for colicin V production